MHAHPRSPTGGTCAVIPARQSELELGEAEQTRNYASMRQVLGKDQQAVLLQAGVFVSTLREELGEDDHALLRASAQVGRPLGAAVLGGSYTHTT